MKLRCPRCTRLVPVIQGGRETVACRCGALLRVPRSHSGQPELKSALLEREPELGLFSSLLPRVDNVPAIYASSELAYVQAADERDYETNVLVWVKRAGFRNAQIGPRGADGGVDVRAVGLVVQVKAQMKPVGVEVVQRTYGLAEAEGAQRRCLPFVAFPGRPWSGQSVMVWHCSPSPVRTGILLLGTIGLRHSACPSTRSRI